MNFVQSFLDECVQVTKGLDPAAIQKMVDILKTCREQEGRVFALGVGGSAANASHLVNDLRKIVLIETYAPTDNVSELTALTNDEGWASCFAGWLQGSHLKSKDVEFKSGIMQSPVCRMAVCLDSEGNSILLHQLKPKTAE